MSATAIVSAEVDEELKEQASTIYAAAGLTISEAFACCWYKLSPSVRSFFMPSAQTLKRWKR